MNQLIIQLYLNGAGLRTYVNLTPSTYVNCIFVGKALRAFLRPQPLSTSYNLGLISQTVSNQIKPISNLLNRFFPSKGLVPTLEKSYKMFFQNVTLSHLTSFILCCRGGRLSALTFLPSAT